MGGAAAALDSGAEELAGPKPRSGKRKLIVMGAPVLVAALGAGLWFSGVLPRLLGHGEAERSEAHAEAKPAAPVFFEMPEMVANLNGNPRRPSYLKLQAKLELARKEDAAVVQSAMPRLLDLFQTYLREMRPEELRGSAGTHRLREELIARANLAIAPARVTDVLFTEILVQ
jgi:flagellar protein FliL